MSLQASVRNLQLIYKYADKIDPVPATVHQLLCNISRITPYLEGLITVIKHNGNYELLKNYLEPIEKAIEEVRKEIKNGNESERT